MLSGIAVDGNRILAANVGLVGLASIPWRSAEAEQALVGEIASDETFAREADAENRSDESAKRFGTQSCTCQEHYRSGTTDFRDRLHDLGIEIDTIVNNATFGALEKFAELSVDRQTDILMVNVIALTRLTRNLLPAVVQPRTGVVLNVGSMAAYQAGPKVAVYYASKAYVLSFTRVLREEPSDTGLLETCLEPGQPRRDLTTTLQWVRSTCLRHKR